MEITISKFGIVQVWDDTTSPAQAYAVAPGDDYSAYPQDVQAACLESHTPEAIAAYKVLLASLEPEPGPAPPDWDALNAAILLDPDWQAATAIVRAINPGLTEALPAAMTQIGSGQTAMFAFLYGQICTIAEVPPAQREAWATMAEGFNLPAEFVDIVRGD